MNIIETPKVGVSGKVLSWEVINEDGSIDRACYRPSNNIITDLGLNFLCSRSSGPLPNDMVYYFCIGTGTAEPSSTDTMLTNETYRANCPYAPYDLITITPTNSDPFYATTQRGVQTPLGALNGTYGEIGFAPGDYYNQNNQRITLSALNSGIFCKHRLVDENGDPTTVTITPSQQLRLKYSFSLCFSPSTSTTGTVNIDGIGNIEYEAKWQYMNESTFGRFLRILKYSEIYLWGIIADFQFSNIGSGPTLTPVQATTSYLTHVWDSHEQIYTGSWSTDIGNTTWYGVAVSSIGYSAPPNFQERRYQCPFIIKFGTPFTKANTHTFRFVIKFSFARSE